MFRATWSWLVPIAVALVVFAAVLLTTPPGFQAISDILLGSPRGPSADAAAYALGAAGSLAFLSLLVLALVLAAIDLAVQRWR
jgi:Mn2+/Fe2+ NRAMP family transporter